MVDRHNRTSFDMDKLASTVARQSTEKTIGGNWKTHKKPPKRQSENVGLTSQTFNITPEQREFLHELKVKTEKFRDPEEMEKTLREMGSLAYKYQPQIDGSQFGTPSGVIKGAINSNDDDQITQIVSEIADTAGGSLGGVGSLVDSNTRDVAEKLASGKLGTSGELAHGILGNTSETLSKTIKDEVEVVESQSRAGVGVSTGVGVAAAPNAAGQTTAQVSVGIQVQVPVPEVMVAAAIKAQGVMQQVTTAMSKGIATIKTLTAIVGQFNGARKLLQVSLQKALDMQIAKMMAPIMAKINMAHGITHPLFLAVFQMTWSENRQWKPGFGEVEAIWMKPLKELVEYFDFVQKVFGGAIAEICQGCEELFTQVCNAAAGMLSSAGIGVSFPIPDLSVPLMSISKQIEDVFNKIMVLKEIIRQKAKMLLSRLKSLSAPDLYINLPKDFFVIFEVLVEAQFIYANLHIVMDKILEFFLNLFVQQFAQIAESIIGQIFGIWKKVIEIVPPLQDLLELCWAIPNQADLCVNLALNIALPNMWAMVEPFVNMPFQCIDMVSKACDAATELAYAIPPP